MSETNDEIKNDDCESSSYITTNENKKLIKVFPCLCRYDYIDFECTHRKYSLSWDEMDKIKYLLNNYDKIKDLLNNYDKIKDLLNNKFIK